MNKEKVLVAGATGHTGKKIVDFLNRSEKYQPVAMIRKEAQKEYFENRKVLTVLGDLEKDISHTVKNIDKVIFAAGSGGKKAVEVDQEGAKKLIDASEEKGIHKFVMLSSMGADNPSVSKDLEEYLKAKQHADDYLKQSGLNYSIVRPGALTNKEGCGKIELEHKLHKFGEISREDVAKTLVEVLDKNVKKNEVFEILEGDTSIEEALNA